MSVPKDLQVELIGSKITNCAILITEQRISKIEKVKTKLAILFHLTNSLGVATATTLHKWIYGNLMALKRLLWRELQKRKIKNRTEVKHSSTMLLYNNLLQITNLTTIIRLNLRLKAIGQVYLQLMNRWLVLECNGVKVSNQLLSNNVIRKLKRNSLLKISSLRRVMSNWMRVMWIQQRTTICKWRVTWHMQTTILFTANKRTQKAKTNN